MTQKRDRRCIGKLGGGFVVRNHQVCVGGRVRQIARIGKERQGKNACYLRDLFFS